MARIFKVGNPANEAEKWAFEFLRLNLDDSYSIVTNVDVYSDNNQPFECDAIIVGEWGVYVVDVKGYQGKIDIGKDVWLFEGKPVENALPKLNQNARILASRCRNRIRSHQHAPWCQGLVFVTGGTGGFVELNLRENFLPVYDKTNIIKALTKAEYLNCQYKHKLESYQKRIALETICDFKLIQDQKDIVSNFKKIKKIRTRDCIEHWKVRPESSDLAYDYTMKYVDLTGLNAECISKYKAMFRKEYVILSELQGIPNIPAPLLLHDDGESAAIVHQSIEGTPLSEFTPTSDESILDVLKNTAKTLQLIMSKGVFLRTIYPQNIFVSKTLEIMFLDIGLARSKKVETIVAKEQLDNPWLAPEYLVKNEYSEKSITYSLAMSFLDFFAADLTLSKSTIEFVEEEFEFNPNKLCELVSGLDEWFASSISISADERPDLVDLIECLENLNITSIEPKKDLFELVEGAKIREKYELEECVGRGATSSIWRTQHIPGRFTCCLKVMERFHNSDEIARKEFEILKELYHPNILKIFDLDYIDGTNLYYLCSEYIDGETLDDFCFNGKYDIWSSFKEILLALQYLHSQSIYHKDIKPHNIMVSRGKSFLIDFNLSSLESRYIGSLSYKDPTVVYKGWSAFSDVYSLVLSFSEISTGFHPFADNDGIPYEDHRVTLTNCSKVSLNLKRKFEQVLNREIEWGSVKDYASWFGLSECSDIKIPLELLEKWGIKRGYQTKVITMMLADLTPRSRNIVIKKTLRNNDIVGNKTSKSSVSAAISALKTSGVVEYNRTKVRITEAFLEDWKKVN